VGDLFNKYFFTHNPPNFDCWDFHINDPKPENELAGIQFLYSEGFPQGKLMYASEAGRGSGCTVLPAADEQAYIGRIMPLYWSWGVKRWYNFGYDTCWPLTNQPATQTLTAAGIAYGNVESWMKGSTMTSVCTLSGSFYTCGLTLANGHQAEMVWYNVFQSTATASYAPASQYTMYKDLSGGTHTMSGPVTVGEQPILLTY